MVTQNTSNNQGWVKLHRKSVESQVWQNPWLWHLFTFCLLKANHKDNHVKLKGLSKPISVKRGQFVTGRDSLLNDLFPKKKKHKPSAITVWRRLKTLADMGNISKQTISNRCSLITIPNYKIYQSDSETAIPILDKKSLNSRMAKSEQQNGQKRTAGSPYPNGGYERKQGKGEQQNGKKRTAEVPKVNTNKNVNKNVNKNEKNIKKYCPTPDGARLSRLLLSEIRKRKSNFREPNLQEWAKHIDRLIRIDRRTPEQIEAVIRWCQQDDFWQNNVLCGFKLRKQIDKLELEKERQNGCKVSGDNRPSGQFVR